MADDTTTITRPADLSIPQDVVDAFSHLHRDLNESGRQQLVKELLSALHQASKLNDLAPVQRVISAWYRTFLFESDPYTEDAFEWSAKVDGSSARTAAEIRSSLSV